MPLEIVTIPCLKDNYAFLVHSSETGETAVVDAPDVAPIQRVLTARGWTLSHIFVTHHHWDHIDGVDSLRSTSGAQVVGAMQDASRLPKLDIAVSESDTFQFGGHDVNILDVSGHTIGHIAYYIPGAKAVFSADSLMALGCGRLFEGTPAQMWASLCKLASLPAETLVCSGHEYTAANARFALTIEPGNAALVARAKSIADAREQGIPTVPSTLDEELATNPFLRAGLTEVKTAINMPDASDTDVFAEIRKRKDHF
jgi:hydroxyacylglutathione hydrolase